MTDQTRWGIDLVQQENKARNYDKQNTTKTNLIHIYVCQSTAASAVAMLTEFPSKSAPEGLFWRPDVCAIAQIQELTQGKFCYSPPPRVKICKGPCRFKGPCRLLELDSFCYRMFGLIASSPPK